MQIVLPAMDDGAIRQRDVDGRQLLFGSRNASECGSKTEKLWPLSWVLGAGNLPVKVVHERVGAIAQQPVWDDFTGIQLLAHHGLDGVTPERNYGANILLR